MRVPVGCGVGAAVRAPVPERRSGVRSPFATPISFGLGHVIVDVIVFRVAVMIKSGAYVFWWRFFEDVVGVKQGHHFRFVRQQSVYQMDEPRVVLIRPDGRNGDRS